MNNKISLIIIIVVLAVGGFLLFKRQSAAPTTTVPPLTYQTPTDPVPPVVTAPSTSTTTTSATTTTTAPKTVEFTIDASPYKFAPSAISVNRGDTIRITVRNMGGMHDLKIDEFNVATRVLNGGESQTITFVANRTGTFEYYCSVGNHRAMGMVGTITVR